MRPHFPLRPRYLKFDPGLTARLYSLTGTQLCVSLVICYKERRHSSTLFRKRRTNKDAEIFLITVLQCRLGHAFMLCPVRTNRRSRVCVWRTPPNKGSHSILGVPAVDATKGICI